MLKLASVQTSEHECDPAPPDEDSLVQAKEWLESALDLIRNDLDHAETRHVANLHLSMIDAILEQPHAAVSTSAKEALIEYCRLSPGALAHLSVGIYFLMLVSNIRRVLEQLVFSVVELDRNLWQRFLRRPSTTELTFPADSMEQAVETARRQIVIPRILATFTSSRMSGANAIDPRENVRPAMVSYSYSTPALHPKPPS